MPQIRISNSGTGYELPVPDLPRRNEIDLLEFSANPIVEVLAVDDESSRHHAEIVVELRRAGSPLPTNDLWIAAVAARHGALVLTYDAHFERITRVGSVVLRSAG